MKKVQSIYQVMQLKVSLHKWVHVGKTNFHFTDKPQNLFKIIGRPARATDEGKLLKPDVAIVLLHPGTYTIIETACVDDTDEEELLARESNEECAAMVSLLFGKRACEIHVGDNVLNGASMSMVLDVIRDPRYQKQRTISDDEFQKASSSIGTPKHSNPAQIELALRWYMKGRREPMGPDAYLSYWVAIEVLFGEWKNLAHKIADRLVRIIPGGFPQTLICERLKIGRLVGLRGDVVHNGKQRFASNEEAFQLIIVREILEEVLKEELGIPGRDRFSKIISDPSEWDRLRGKNTAPSDSNPSLNRPAAR